MSRVLIIGYGNPLRCDDGFGWHLAERLQATLRNPEVEVVACHQLTPDLAERIRHADYVVFADATTEPLSDKVSLRRLQTEHGADAAMPASVSHHLDPQALLTMAHTLYGACHCTAFLLTANPCDLGYGAKLSPPMEGTLDLAVKRMMGLCEFLAPTSLPYSLTSQLA